MRADMTAVEVALICVAAALACALLRGTHPELATGVALAGGIAALYLLRADLQAVAELLGQLAEEARLREGHAALLLKASGIALVSEFGADLCRDAGERALAGRIELGARVVLLAMAAPLLQELFALIGALTA